MRVLTLARGRGDGADQLCSLIARFLRTPDELAGMTVSRRSISLPALSLHVPLGLRTFGRSAMHWPRLCNLLRARGFTLSRAFSLRCLMPDDSDLASIRGTVRSLTTFGVFFAAGTRSFFLPYSMLPCDRRFKPGQTVTLRLPRDYGRQEMLIKKTGRDPGI